MIIASLCVVEKKTHAQKSVKLPAMPEHSEVYDYGKMIT